MTKLGELDLKGASKQAAGNWKLFSCFVWYRDPEPKKPEDWVDKAPMVLVQLL